MDTAFGIETLSEREQQVLALIAHGLTNGQIADRLDIRFDTAKWHVSSIISKLGVDSREDAAEYWREQNRLPRRFARAMRGLIGTSVLKTVATGAAVVTLGGAGIATGLAFLNSDGQGGSEITIQAPASTLTPAPPEPAPVLGGYVISISPEHASRIAQSLTTSPDDARPGGVCAEVNFQGLSENAQWFRMALDGAEVTTMLTWVVASLERPQGGRVCYAPTAGFSLGHHTAAISVQDPRNPASPARQTVAWWFDVTP